MGSFIAAMIAAAPLSASPGSSASATAGAQVVIVRAERVVARPAEDGVQRNIRHVPGGVIVDFN